MMKVDFLETFFLGLSNQTQFDNKDFLDEKIAWVALVALSSFVVFPLLANHLLPLIGISVIIWVAGYHIASFEWDKVDKTAFEFLALFSNTLKTTSQLKTRYIMRASGASNTNPYPSSMPPASQGFGGPNSSSSTPICGGLPPGLNSSRVSASPNYSGPSALMPTYSSGIPPQSSMARGAYSPQPNFSGSGALAAQYSTGNPPSSNAGYGGPNLDPSRISGAPNYSGPAALAGQSNIPGYVPPNSVYGGRGCKGPNGSTWS